MQKYCRIKCNTSENWDSETMLSFSFSHVSCLSWLDGSNISTTGDDIFDILLISNVSYEGLQHLKGYRGGVGRRRWRRGVRWVLWTAARTQSLDGGTYDDEDRASPLNWPRSPARRRYLQLLPASRSPTTTHTYCTIEMCMGMGTIGIPSFPWDFHVTHGSDNDYISWEWKWKWE